MERYNIDMTNGIHIHYLIADTSGRAALVEFHQGEMVVIPNEEPWHQATNFLRASVDAYPEGACWRYDHISARLAEAGGRLTMLEAMELLTEVSQENTQWSLVYGMHTGEAQVVMDRMYEQVYTFSLENGGEQKTFGGQ
jgi:hypothetical protein